MLLMLYKGRKSGVDDVWSTPLFVVCIGNCISYIDI